MELADAAQSDSAEYVPRTLALGDQITRSNSSAETLPIAPALAKALAALHGLKLVHRDIKPSNVIFVAGEPKLADIGLISSSTSQSAQLRRHGRFHPARRPLRAASGQLFHGHRSLRDGTGKHHRDFPEPPANLSSLAAADRAALLELTAIIHKATQTIRAPAANPPMPSSPTSNTSPPATPSNFDIRRSKSYPGHGKLPQPSV